MEISLAEAINMGIKAHKKRQFDEAKQIYSSILAKYPNHPDVCHNMAVLYLDLNDEKSAVELFSKAINANPQVAQYWISYLNTLISLKRMDEARKIYQQAEQIGITRDPFQKIRERLANIDSDHELNCKSPPKAAQLTTKQVAGVADIHRDTLLRWLRKGLIPEPKRNHKGWRLFTTEEAEAVRKFAIYGDMDSSNGEKF